MSGICPLRDRVSETGIQERQRVKRILLSHSASGERTAAESPQGWLRRADGIARHLLAMHLPAVRTLNIVVVPQGAGGVGRRKRSSGSNHSDPNEGSLRVIFRSVRILITNRVRQTLRRAVYPWAAAARIVVETASPEELTWRAGIIDSHSDKLNRIPLNFDGETSGAHLDPRRPPRRQGVAGQ